MKKVFDKKIRLYRDPYWYEFWLNSHTLSPKVQWVIIFILSILVYKCSQNTNQSITIKPQPDVDIPVDVQKGINAYIVEKILQEDSKIALDAIITDADVLYVSVKDDGTSRNGLADYFCNYLTSTKSKCRWVKIVAVGSQNSEFKDNAYGILLGESHCGLYEE